jgi:hypothetical protein
MNVLKKKDNLVLTLKYMGATWREAKADDEQSTALHQENVSKLG